jgi:hypothetical protein
MPYLPKERIEEIKNDPLKANRPGDLNYLVSMLIIIPMWLDKPNYSTVHALKKLLVVTPEKCIALTQLLARLPNEVYRTDLFVAAALAFDEFYRRVGSKYEDGKAEENGDLYQPLLELMKEPKGV